MRIEQKLIIPLLIITVGNLIHGYFEKKEIIYFLARVIIFIPIIILFIFLPKFKKIESNKHKFISITLLVLSCVGVWFGDYTDLISITLFFISVYISAKYDIKLFSIKKNKTIIIIYLSLLFVFILLKFTLLGLTVSQMAVFLGGASFLLILYQHYIHPKKIIKEDIIPNYLIYPVKKDIVDTIRLIILGYEYHEINDKLGLCITADRVRRNVNTEIKRLGFRNREHMIFFLTENGIIKSISYDVDTKDKSHDIL